LAFEADKAIFDALIAPMMRKAVVSQPPLVVATATPGDMEEDDIVVECVVKTTRFSK